MVSLYRGSKTLKDILDLIEGGSTKSSFDINAWRFGKVDKREDESSRYLKAQLLVFSSQEAANFDLLEWWRGNAKEYSTLAKIPVDIFSIPATCNVNRTREGIQ
jgi:hypothetical protein